MTHTTDPSEIPFERLPDGFAERVEAPPEPATPRPAATLVLMRRADPRGDGLEVLLVRRVRSAGFVPGAWVFPGGRVDRSDGGETLLDLLAPSSAATTPGCPDDYLVAAIREAFEETGILVARDAQGIRVPTAAADTEIDQWRERLLAGESTFLELLRKENLRMDRTALGYIAHWITPEPEPRRYDTRFLAAAVPASTEARIHEVEISHESWLSPEVALERHAAGELPMVFPTVKTLEALRPFDTPEAVLDHFREMEIPATRPRLVRTPTGIGIRMPDEE